MDGSLLQMFADAARGRLTGVSFGPVRWLRPLLSLPIRGRGTRGPGIRGYLVVIVETPGPFCYLADEDPLDSVDGVLRFPQLAGSTVLSFDRRAGERVLEIRTETAGETGGPLLLRLFLFGSLGRAELARGEVGRAELVRSGR